MDKIETVRIAGPDDMSDIYWLLLGDYERDNSLGWTPSPRKVARMVGECCRQESGIAGIIDGLHGPIGSVGLEVHNPRWSDDQYLVQAWIFVQPEHRFGKHHWEDLFAFCAWWQAWMSEQTGKPMILESSVQSHNRLPAKLRLWRRRAGVQVGGTFWSVPVAEMPKP